MAIFSLVFTSAKTRKSNNFTWAPITEVAFLFFGIFITMTPALIYLQFNASKLGLTTPEQFYYVTGALSSFLDNAPTAVALHSLALGLEDQFATLFSGIPLLAGIPVSLLKAISVGAVFFGSMTYIGNGPNFMVKAIAEELELKPTIINKAIAIAHKDSYRNLTDDLDVLESILVAAGKL